MKSLVKKVEDSGNHKIMLTDRGITFGYNLVSDFRVIHIMKAKEVFTKCKAIYEIK